MGRRGWFVTSARANTPTHRSPRRRCRAWRQTPPASAHGRMLGSLRRPTWPRPVVDRPACGPLAAFGPPRTVPSRWRQRPGSASRVLVVPWPGPVHAACRGDLGGIRQVEAERYAVPAALRAQWHGSFCSRPDTDHQITRPLTRSPAHKLTTSIATSTHQEIIRCMTSATLKRR